MSSSSSTTAKRICRRATKMYGEEIVEAILLPLPAKSLKRFQGISKMWSALITEPYFVQKHLNQVKSKADNNDEGLNFLLNTRPLMRSIHTSIKDLKRIDGTPIATMELAPPIRSIPLSTSSLVGSIHGLIYLEYHPSRSIVIWNPCTGESNLLQQNPNPNAEHRDCCSKFYGFGYDSKAEDYKVILGFSEEEDSSNGGRLTYGGSWPLTTVDVFSLKSGTWRRQGGHPAVQIDRQGCLVDETLHWIYCINDDAPLVRCFNLREEKFWEYDLSSIPVEDTTTFITGVLNVKNIVAVYSMTFEKIKEYKIWLMNNGACGVRNLWNEVANVDSRISLTPILVSKEGGEMLAVFDGFLALYSPRHKRFTKARYDKI